VVEPDKNPFAELSLFTQERDRLLSGSRQAEPAAAVTVLERKVVGVYDVAVLRAGDPQALGDWLTANGYKQPDSLKDILAGYVKKGWLFVAMRIDPKALATDEVTKLKTGQLQPIKFVFPCEEMVYPLRISSINAGTTEVLLYLLADAPMVRAAGPDHAGFAPPAVSLYVLSGQHKSWAIDPRYTTAKAVSAKELPLTWAALDLDPKIERHLVKYRVEFTGKEMTADLTFKPFDPIAYWRNRLAEAKEPILQILATLDKTYEQPLAQVRAEIRAVEVAEMRRLASSPEAAERAKLGDSRYVDVPGDVLETLAADPDPKVRRAIAWREELTEELRKKLLTDATPAVRVAAAYNRRTPAETRATILARDTELSSRGWLAYSGSDPMLLKLLASDKEVSIRERVAQNHACPPDVIRTLAVDPDPGVRASTVHYHGKGMPLELLATLARDPSAGVRRAVARHQRTPQAILEQLTSDSEQDIQQLAKETLERLRALQRPTSNPGEP
jgi:hypothetical protein